MAGADAAAEDFHRAVDRAAAGQRGRAAGASAADIDGAAGGQAAGDTRSVPEFTCVVPV